ncbi:hypothetical protein SAMN05216167_12118 [Spirosoma endophyticum]|uniref:Outer membrane protein beta-barrel domain-containing protein n=2 Tax=Spirosoma endophyticum TaxID=662367 RepID=A0A1I2E4V0_9BACT|nr:hypothetical protein SAMN05216167_12118 [Spirosoma endophyticum]
MAPAIKLYILALICFPIQCLAQETYYEKPLKNHRMMVSIGASTQLLPTIIEYQKFIVRPQIGLSYRLNYKAINFEPEIILRSSLTHLRTPSNVMPNCSICYEEYEHKGASIHLILPVTLRYKRFGISIGTHIELPSMRYTFDEVDSVFTPIRVIRVAEWQERKKPIFGFYFGLQYNVKRYQFRVYDMTKKYLYDGYIRKPQILSFSLGYRL